MTSNRPSDRLDLERDLPTTPEDVAAQRRLRVSRVLSFQSYCRFLASFDPPSAERLRRERAPRGDEVFELPIRP